jgi:hypothetical protein
MGSLIAAMFWLAVAWLAMIVGAIAFGFTKTSGRTRGMVFVAGLCGVPAFVLVSVAWEQLEHEQNSRRHAAIELESSRKFRVLCQAATPAIVKRTHAEPAGIVLELRQKTGALMLDVLYPPRKKACWLNSTSEACDHANLKSVQWQYQKPTWCMHGETNSNCDLTWNLDVKTGERTKLDEVRGDFVLVVSDATRIEPMVYQYDLSVVAPTDSTPLAELRIYKKGWHQSLNRLPGESEEPRTCPDSDTAVSEMLARTFPLTRVDGLASSRASP